MEKNMPMGLRFSLLHRSFMKRLDARLQEKGLTGVQFGVLGQLRRLRRAGQSEINQRDLEAAMRVTHPTMTEIIRRLEKQGFVRCTPSARDRRFKCIEPTEKAVALQKEMDELDGAIFQDLCRDFSDEEIAQLTALVDRMLENAFSDCHKKPDGGESAGD